ncbi:unknown [Bacteroides sp. CAG:875]|nr:unknown [Bacteroides sp. CAG:875]
MFQKCCTFAPSNKKTTIVLLILGYGVMVTQQILVLFFLVRIRVAQLHFAAFPWRKQSVLGYGVMVTQQILVLFFLVRIRVAQQKGVSI